jgi:hypothetical protein
LIDFVCAVCLVGERDPRCPAAACGWAVRRFDLETRTIGPRTGHRPHHRGLLGETDIERYAARVSCVSRSPVMRAIAKARDARGGQICMRRREGLPDPVERMRFLTTPARPNSGAWDNRGWRAKVAETGRVRHVNVARKRAASSTLARSAAF